jgi:ABC-2 type transport system permease protein
MRLSQAWLIARHDIGLFRRRRGIIAGLIAMPLGVGIGFPALVGYIVQKNGTMHLASYLPSYIDAFSFWFVIGAAVLPTTIAAYGIVGEKVERSLEPLLATPTTDGEILLGKLLAAFVPTMLAIWAGSALFQFLVDLFTRTGLGYLYYPNWEMALILFLLAPLACIYAVEVSILVSARVTDVRTAQQYSGVIFLPLIFLYIGGLVGFTLDTTHLLEVAGLLGVIAVLLYFVSLRTFHREEILTSWK